MTAHPHKAGHSSPASDSTTPVDEYDSVPEGYQGPVYTCPMYALAEAIVRRAEEREIKMAKAEDFEAVTGKGVRGTVDGKAVALGNRALLLDLGVEVGASAKRVDSRRDDGETVMFVVLDGTLAGLVSVADPVKASTPAALKELHALGFRIIMATVDNERTARTVPGRLGIDEIRADVLPQHKAEIVRELQEQGLRVAVAGVGVNDAPAPAQSDVGIAMGSGADVAIESAGLFSFGETGRNRPGPAAQPRHHAQHRQNLFFALIYNASGVPVAAGVL